jgi:aminoglycoside phosphotransferase family enzyme
VTLNRRLASDVYLGAVPLTVDTHGSLHLAGRGRTVDWLVHMRRLPAEQTLERAVIDHRVRETDVRRVVERLAEFYGSAAPVAIDPVRYRRRFEEEAHAIRSELARPRFGLPPEVVERLAAAQLAFLAAHGDLLEERAQEGRIVEGHGDLRPEHIYLASDPIVMDCLEFNRDFRILDPADELAYLAMECDRLGATFIDDWLFATYCDRASDRPPRILLEFYKCARAYLRAKIAIWHLDEPEVREPSKWTRRDHEYLQLAQAYARRLT